MDSNEAMETNQATTCHTAHLRRRTRRCTTLVAQRVPISSSTTADDEEDEYVERDDSVDTRTPSMGSAGFGTVSALLSAYRHKERCRQNSEEMSGTGSVEVLQNKENHASSTASSNPYDLLTTPLHQRKCAGPRGRTPRPPLSVLKETTHEQWSRVAAHQPAAAATAPDAHQGTVAGEEHRGCATGRPTGAAAGGLTRGASESRLPSCSSAAAGSAGGLLRSYHSHTTLTTAASSSGSAVHRQQSAPAVATIPAVQPPAAAHRLGQVKPCVSLPQTSSVVTQTHCTTSETSSSAVYNQSAGSSCSLGDNSSTGPTVVACDPAASHQRTPLQAQPSRETTGGTARSRPVGGLVSRGGLVHQRPLGSTQTPRPVYSGVPENVGSRSTPVAADASSAARDVTPRPVPSHLVQLSTGSTQHQDTPRPAPQKQQCVPVAASSGTPPVTVGGGGFGVGVDCNPADIYPTPPSESSTPLSASAGSARVPVAPPPSDRQRQHSGFPTPPNSRTDLMSSRADCWGSSAVPSRSVVREMATQTDNMSMGPPPPPPPTSSMMLGKRQLTAVSVNGRELALLGQIGRGGSSKVYRVMDSKMQCSALKQVTLEDCDPATMEGFINEIELLGKLQHSNRVVRLMDWEHRRCSKTLYILMEIGDTDLASLMRNYAKVNEVSASMCKFFWEEMLRCVEVIHREGIVHSDLKPANFLMVSGRLKLIDFGIASQIQSDCTSIIKDYQLGTFNYMSPEAIESQQITRNGSRQTVFKISRRSDVWSLGCILYNFVYGHTPFSEIKQMMAKMMAIINPDHRIEFAAVSTPHLREVLQGCLQRDPYQRPTIEQLLHGPYLTS